MDITKSKFKELLVDNLQHTEALDVDMYFNDNPLGESFKIKEKVSVPVVNVKLYKKTIELSKFDTIEDFDAYVLREITTHAINMLHGPSTSLEELVASTIEALFSNTNVNIAENELQNILMYHNCEDDIKFESYIATNDQSIIDANCGITFRKLDLLNPNEWLFIINGNRTLKFYANNDNYGIFIFPDSKDYPFRNSRIVKVTVQ
jgi:hypothetical protein